MKYSCKMQVQFLNIKPLEECCLAYLSSPDMIYCLYIIPVSWRKKVINFTEAVKILRPSFEKTSYQKHGELAKL